MSRDSEHTPPRRRRIERRPHAELGQSLTELAIALPLLLLVVLGVLELGRLLETQHIMSALTREGANLASRGTSMVETLELTMDSAEASLGAMGDDACIIVTEIRVDEGAPGVVRQEPPGGGCGDTDSRVGGAFDDANLLDGHTYFVVEIFVSYRPFPFDFNQLIEDFVPETLYDRSLF